MAKCYETMMRGESRLANPARPGFAGLGFVRLGFIVPILLIAFTVVGCGSGGRERAAVHGTVTIGGQPVQEGSITFLPCDGNKGPSAGASIKDGKYEITEKGPALGMYRVTVRASRKTGRKIPMAGSNVPTIDQRVSIVPKRFTGSSSPLKFDIKSGADELNIEIPAK